MQDKNVYADEEINPLGPPPGWYKVLRGGGWSDVARRCRSASRRNPSPHKGVDGRHTHKGIYKWGVDFIVTDKNRKPYKDSGNDLDEHYCYNMPVTSPGDGVVYAVESFTPDNPVTKTNLDYSWGNYAIIQHNPSLFSILCHLGQQRVSVNTNDIIKKGEHIGHVGSSGLAPYPHLHVQFQSSGVAGASTVPVHFSDYLVKNKDYDEYVPLGMPEEKQVVSNLPADSHVRDAIGIELGHSNTYELRKNGKKYTEVWNCDMDSLGILFIESSLYKDRLFFLQSERSISFCQYAGRKDSGLYMLSLALDKIPYYADRRLQWQKHIPYFQTVTGVKSFLWETVLPYVKRDYILATHTFKAVGSRFVLTSDLVAGKKLLAKRSILFDHGLAELKYKTKDKVISLEKID